MSIAEEEQQVYATFSRPVATGINFFSFFSAEIDEDSETATLSYTPAVCDKAVAKKHAEALADYVKQTLRDLRKGRLTTPSQIQRRMYWFLSKIYEYNVFSSGGLFKLIAMYQMSVVELEEV